MESGFSLDDLKKLLEVSRQRPGGLICILRGVWPIPRQWTWHEAEPTLKYGCHVGFYLGPKLGLAWEYPNSIAV